MVFEKKSKNRIKSYIALLVGVTLGAVCLIYISYSFHWQDVWSVLRQADLLLFVTSSIVILISYWFVRALRWRVLLNVEDKQVPFVEFYLYTAFTAGLSLVTPFQSGEALKVELLRKHGGERVTGYAVFALERILDLLTLLIIAATGLGSTIDGEFLPYIYGLLFVAIVGSACVFALLVFAPYRKLREFRGWACGMWNVQTIGAAFLLTVVSWLLVAAGWNLVLRSIGIALSGEQTLTLLSLTTLFGILSFVPGAIGVAEISVTQILSRFGFELAQAQSGALILRCFFLMVLILATAHYLLLILRRGDDLKRKTNLQGEIL